MVADINPKFFNHPLLQKNLIQWRDYQISITENTFHQNTLVVLPTALGKTLIALITAVKILKKAPNSKIFMLAPTRPLVMQHYESFVRFLNPEIKCCLFSSNLTPIKRTYALNHSNIFFSTPQILQNDLKAGLYNLNGVGLLIIDETHKARKKYAYTYVANSYLEQCRHPLILGLTASPGKDVNRINELCATLQIENVIFRDHDSPDVQKYTHTIDTIVKKIDMPTEIITSKAILESALRKIRDYLIELEILPKRNYYSKVDFIRLIQDLKILDFLLDSHLTQNDLDKYGVSESNLNFPQILEVFLFLDEKDEKKSQMNRDKLYSTIFFQSINGIYLEHLNEILSVQDVRLYRSYIKKLESRAANGNKRVKRLLKSKPIVAVNQILKNMEQSPKIPILKQILIEEFSNNPEGKIIIFNQYREMAQYLVKAVNNFSKECGIRIKAQRFVGQASKENDKGLSQKEQTSMIHQFSNADFNVLIATSVAEEGLDIPNVNAIIFYESVPSEIRLIQRRGRTGRHDIGKCYCLVNENTLDEIYHIVSHRKEEKMHQLLSTPGAIATVPELDRDQKMPSYQKKTLNQITQSYNNIKAEKEKIKLEQVKKLVSERHSTLQIPNKLLPSNNFSPNSDPKLLVNDYTNILTQQSKIRINHQSNEAIKIPKNMVKKIFNWIISTMECLGTKNPSSNHLVCNVTDFFSAVEDEDMDKEKIEQELEKGLKAQIFLKTKTKLSYIMQ